MTCQLEGRCFCGAVRYRVTSTVQEFYYCECAQCRRLTGSIAAANLCMAPAPIEWLDGEDHVRVFRATDGRDFSKAFCSRCGSGLPWLNTAGDALIIPAGSLDTPPPLAVQRRIFAAERPHWAVLDHELPAHSGFAD